MKKVIIVDTNDEIIGVKSYAELQYEDIYRVTALWLADLSGKYALITQRKLNKRNDPGKWMMAVSGTVEEGETYESNIQKETEEEIGLIGLNFKKELKIFNDDGLHKFFVQLYSAQVDKDESIIKIQESEVEQYRWILVEDLLNWFSEKPEDFVISMKQSFEAVGIKL